MALIPLIFKNNDNLTGETPVYSKTGKVPPAMARAINSYSLYNKFGIFHGYANECFAEAERDVGNNRVVVTFRKGLVSVYGGVMLVEDGTELIFTQPSSNTTGYIGIGVDLTKEAGDEADFFVKSVGFNTDNLQSNETTGRFDLILFKYVVDASGEITLTYYNQVTQTNEALYIYDSNQVIDLLVNGAIKVKESEITSKIRFVTTPPTSSPDDGMLVIYTGTTTPATRYDRVLYLIS